MLSKARLTAIAASLLIVSATAAVQAQMPARRTLGLNGVPEGYTRVTANLNIFVPGPTGDSEEAEKLRDRARRLIYSTAARECDILRETLASDCMMESLNSNLVVGQRYQPNQPEGYNVNATIVLNIKLKKD